MALGLSIAAVLAAALASTTSAGGSAPVCRAGQLRGQLLDSSGAAGTIVLSVTLVNDGASCSLKGYSGLLLVRGTSPLATRVRHGGIAILSQKPKVVILGAGGVATIFVAYGDVAVGGERRCPASTDLLVQPPGQSDDVLVAVHARACNHGTLRESPVLLGRHHAT